MSQVIDKRHKPLYKLMKVALESPPVLTDSDLEEIVVIWNRKSFVNIRHISL